MENNIVIRADNIIKYFYEPIKFQVLQGISLQVNRGEFVSIVGKSGCGKSTLLYVLSTMDTDYEGALEIYGQLLTGESQNYLAHFRNQHIGFVFQFHYLLPEFTVIENVMTPAMKLGKHSKSEISDRAYEKLKLLDIADQALKPAKNLSGGQQQRAAIARALINDPALIIGDEPTGNLDSHNADAIFQIFSELAKTNQQTIVVVTHDVEFASRTDRRIEMCDGRIVS